MFGNFWTYFTVSLVVVLGWQHYARMHNINFRPGVFLQMVANLCEYFWTQLGKLWAFVSNFVNLINFREFWYSVKEMFTAVGDILMSFRYFKYAYDTAINLYDNPLLVKVGSWLLCCAFLCVCLWKRQDILMLCRQLGAYMRLY